MRLLWTVAAVALATLLLLMAGCSGDGTLLAELSPGFAGSAVKGPIADAEVKAFHFDPAGTEIEITAINAPVYTDAAGSFEFRVAPGEMALVTSPIIVRTMGGTMFGRAAPTLEGVIPDPEALTYGQVTLDCQLSTASCVAAGLLRKQVAAQGAAPQPHDADQIFALVESELGVDLSECPADAETCVARVNHCVDQNLDLKDQPESAQIVGHFVDYLVANLSSSSQELDDRMADPANPASDIPASFVPFGMLATVLPDGPTGYVELAVESDQPYIGIDGSDTATIRATLTDACGHAVPDAGDLVVARISGNANVDPVNPPTNSSELEILVTASTIGTTVVEVSYALDNSNNLSRQVTIQAVDLLTDSDGDGRPDGLETIGWTVVVDMVGYGDAAVGKLLTIREVTSDPTMADTDGDGLTDLEEYLYRTDPRILDTDGDGLNDHEECYRWITNPCSVDTDGDARGPNGDQAPSWWNFDGNELTMLKTSPTLEDTDGDGWTDFEEADHPTRSPIISDLPKLEIEIVDDIDVRLDVQYAEQVGKTSQYGTSFSKSRTVSVSSSHSRTLGYSLELGGELSAGTTGSTFKASYKHTFKVDNTYSTSHTDSNTSQESYSQYATDSRTHTETAASGSMSLGVRLRNVGPISYTITQLGLTVRLWEPASRRFRTLATLTPSLQGGFTLAPGATTPVLQVQAANLNASRVKDFLAKPDSLHLESAYYELENAEGLNFGFLEQITGPQTATVLIDSGNGTTEEYRVATNVGRTPNGGWAGIKMSRILGAEVLDIPFGVRSRDMVDPSASTTEEVLDSVRELRTDVDSDTGYVRGFWTVVVESDPPVDPNTNFGDIVLHGGDSVLLAYVRDADGDGLWGPEEQHYRTESGTADTDGDGLSDVEEIRGTTFVGDDNREVPCGWEIELKDLDGNTASRYPVVSDPANSDQDGDGLNDFEEKMGWRDGEDKGLAATDPTRPDTDNDGVRDDIDPYPVNPARVLYVKADATGQADGSSWANAYTDLQEALVKAKDSNDNIAADDDVAEIWVARGVYTPNAGSFQLVDRVGIYGGFTGAPSETKQTHRQPDPYLGGAQLDGNGNSVVVSDYSVTEAATIDGFVIRNGAASSGAGLTISGNLTIRNLLILDNEATVDGGGVSYRPAAGLQMTTSISNCIFSSNKASSSGGAIFYDGRNHLGSLRVTDCRFQQNVSETYGGAIVALGEIQVTRCDFNDNRADTAGGALSLSDGVASISDCRIAGNSTTVGTSFNRGGGVLVGYGGNAILRQCAIRNNYADSGAGVYVLGRSADTSHLTLYHCTVSRNQARNGAGGGLFFDRNTSAAIENSIVYDNDCSLGTDLVSEIWTAHNNTWPWLKMRNSCVANWKEALGFSPSADWWGVGNTDSDPVLGDDLRLGSDSSCIDRGTNYLDYDPRTHAFDPLPMTDLAGDWRIVDGDKDGDATVDMGAYEYQGGS